MNIILEPHHIDPAYVEVTPEELGVLLDVFSRCKQVHITDNTDYILPTCAEGRHVESVPLQATILHESVPIYDSMAEFDERSRMQELRELRAVRRAYDLDKLIKAERAAVEDLKAKYG